MKGQVYFREKSTCELKSCIWKVHCEGGVLLESSLCTVLRSPGREELPKFVSAGEEELEVEFN